MRAWPAVGLAITAALHISAATSRDLGIAVPLAAAAQAQSGLTLACEGPADSVGTDGTATITCTAADAEQPVEGIAIHGEIVASERPGVTSAPPPDFSAISDADGRVNIAYGAASGGTDTFCGWIDADKDPKNINDGDISCRPDPDTVSLTVAWKAAAVPPPAPATRAQLPKTKAPAAAPVTRRPGASPTRAPAPAAVASRCTVTADGAALEPHRVAGNALTVGDALALQIAGDGRIGDYDVFIERGGFRATVLSGKGGGASTSDVVSLAAYDDGVYTLRVRAEARACNTDAFVAVKQDGKGFAKLALAVGVPVLVVLIIGTTALLRRHRRSATGTVGKPERDVPINERHFDKKPNPDYVPAEPARPEEPPVLIPGKDVPVVPLDYRTVPLRHEDDDERHPADCVTALGDWQTEGDAFAQGRVLSSSVPASTVRIAGHPVVPIGGDYWHTTPYPIGRFDGRWWGSALGPNGDRATGSATTVEMVLNHRYLHFLLGGSRPVDNPYERRRLEVQLLIRWTPDSSSRIAGDPTTVRDGVTYAIVRRAAPQGNVVLSRVVWDVARYRGLHARVRIVDDWDDRHINAADFQCTEEQPPEERPPVWGVADLHCHPMSMLGYGGKLIAGYYQPEQGDDVSVLVHCEHIHGVGGSGLWGGGVLRPLIGMIPEGEFGHLTGGYPEFDGWPKFQNMIHNQMHPSFIRRAYDGGLRVMCALAVHNEMLADQSGRSSQDQDLSDRQSIEDQIRWWQQVVGRCNWMEIAGSPREARDIVLRNKLAVVLGIEVDSALGMWRRREDLPTDAGAARAAIRARVEQLYEMGIRQINPIHVTNNAFGGTAVYRDEFNVANRFNRGDYIAVDGQADVDFRLAEHESEAIWLLRRDPLRTAGAYAAGASVGGPAASASAAIVGGIVGLFSGGGFYSPPDYNAMYPGLGHVNSFGLNDVGEIGIQELMLKGMLIDVDHMSQLAIDRTLAIVSSASYPVLSAHSSFRELSPRRPSPSGRTPHQRHKNHKWPHESEKPSSFLTRLRDIGGMVGPITAYAESLSHAEPPRVENNCSGSVKSWAQEYLYAVDLMRGRGVGIGTDMNSLLAQLGPRFGTQAAWAIRDEPGSVAERRAQADAQFGGVRYSSPIRDYRAYRFQERDVYEWEERDIWEAIAIVKCGLDPHRTRPEGPGAANRTDDVQNKINNVAKGFFCNHWRDLESRHDALGGDTYAEQRAAFLVKFEGRWAEPHVDIRLVEPEYREPDATRRLYPRIRAIWQKWRDMEGSNVPLQRSVVGRRDYDINLDGFAHYGLLPDVWQDLKNCLATSPTRATSSPTFGAPSGVVSDAEDHRDMNPLFRSAEDFIELWERCQAFADRASAGSPTHGGTGP